MPTSNSTNVDQGAISEFAVSQFNLGLRYFDFSVSGFKLSEPVRLKIAPALAVALIASGLFTTLRPEEGKTTPTWHRPFSEPVRSKSALPTGQHPFLSYVGAWTQNGPIFNFAEQTSYDKYGYAWSEPVRQKLGLLTGTQEFFKFGPLPSVSFAWNYEWTTPVRLKRGLRPELHQFYTNDTIVLPETRQLEWYNWLNAPVRLKSGLGHWLAPAVTFHSPLQPVIFSIYEYFTDPIWPKRGLGTHLQQSLAYHPRLLPNPTVTAVMNTKETNNDVALFGVCVYSPITPTTNAVLANVSITEIPLIQGAAASIEA